MSDVLKHVPALAPRELLTRLARMASQGEDTPEVVVMLHTGASVQGRIVALSDGNDSNFLLATDRNAGAAAYFPAASVIGVVVQQARAYVHVISFGAVDAAPDSPPTRLGLKREVAEHGQALSKKLGSTVNADISIESFAETPESLWSVTLALRDLVAAIDLVASQADGLAELKRQVTGITVKPAPHPNLSLHGQILTFEIASQAGPKGRLSKSTLHERLEKLL